MSKLIEKEGKFYKECGVVMLNSDKESVLYLREVWSGPMLCRSSISYKQESFPNQQNQHLYITSDDEIKEGDKVLIFNNEGNIKIFSPKICSTVAKSMNLSNKDSDPTQHKYKKIIATTDKSIGFTDHKISPVPNFCEFPQPSDKFIQAYIDAFNKGEKIEKVLVEYTKNGYSKQGKSHFEILDTANQPFPKDVGNLWFNWEPKLKDNNIIIKKMKDSWSREELLSTLNVESLREKFHSQSGMFINKQTSYEIIQWIKDSL